ncbi:MAG: hypothetical protein EXX96DRAFT_534069 [Benjaminiella poitrasii]|nr:MAG: hypothetical protein EXX96DRAFT_534069 [Benjaminiella poitrasii]
MKLNLFAEERKKRDEPETLSPINIGSDDSSNDRHRIRKTSQSEYYDICGYNSATKIIKAYAEQYVNIVNVINRIPTLKTINPQSYIESIRYIPVNYNSIIDYFSHQEFLKCKWKAKQLLSGSSKYGYIVEEMIHQNEQKWKPLDPQDSIDEERKAVVIAFGEAFIPTSMAGIRSDPNKLLRKHLQLHVTERRRRSPTFLTYINTSNTLKVCPKCQTKSLENVTESHSNWNRDHMASINIRSVFMYMTVNENKRRYYFQTNIRSPDMKQHSELIATYICNYVFTGC